MWYDRVTGLYNARNRLYNPPFARFNQPDPNGQALALASTLARNGQTMSAFTFLSPGAQYSNGMHLYIFAGNNPATQRDPSGLTNYIETTTVASIGAYLVAAMSSAVTTFEAWALTQIGAAVAYSYVSSVAAIAAASTAMNSVDPAAMASLASELERWMSALPSSDATHVAQGFQDYVNNVSSGASGQDPKNWSDAAKRFQHTLKHAKEWFGTRDLTPAQIEQWGRNIEYVARSRDTFQWTLRGPMGTQQTIAHLAKVDGKWLCVQFYESTMQFATAFIPNASQLEAMKRLAFGQ